MMKQFVLLTLLAISLPGLAQRNLKGKIVDADTNEPLIGAAVMIDGTTNGVITGFDGSFNLDTDAKTTTLLLKYIGYKDKTHKVSENDADNLGTIRIAPDAIGLGEVSVTASVGVTRKTPIAMSTLTPKLIEEKLGTQEFPEIFKSTPGVWATKGPGGYGDSKINMRGFQSANVAVLINGVPMNDMEWGGLYWSNWAGLSDVIRTTQTQRGVGASKVSAPSVGGSINIVTTTTEAKKGGAISYGVGSDGYNKMLFNVSTGLNENGWALTLLGAKTWGDGYVQGTEFQSYNYFASIAKIINDRHQISLTAFGSPQEHYQRSSYDGLTIEGWQQVKNYMKGDNPYKYNPTYGFGLHGERKTSSYNQYHKPQISMNHQWQINDKSSLSTALYTSIGRGSGYSGQGATSTYSGYWYGSSNGVLNTTFRNSDGTFAYDQIYHLNAASQTGSLMAMSKSINAHNWYGLLSTYNTTVADYFDITAGIDMRYYKGQHTNELIDLYGADYYIDRYRASVSSANHAQAGTDEFNYKKLQVGDVVYRDYDGYVMQEGGFGQVEYNRGKISAFAAGSLSNTSYWRYDRFYYDKDNAKSETLSFIGYTAKGGANYNLTDHHNVFANVGYISRAPFFSGGAFLSSTVSNATNPDAVNEKIFSVEAGYGFRTSWMDIKLNAYRTEWRDKSMTKSFDISENGIVIDRASVNMTGVNALHQGIEVELASQPLKWLELTAMFSYGDWTWNNNATGYFYNNGGQPLADTKGTIASGIQAADHASIKLNMKGVEVGGSAQTTAAAGAKIKFTKDLRMGIDYNFAARNYADWSVSSSDLVGNAEKTYVTPWKIPSFSTVDMNASYSFDMGSTRATFSGNVENLLDQEYIAEAYDGGTHNWDSAYRVFYGFGRTYSVRLKVSF
ncbi:MAG: TonB-dependent receptor [Marinilabiliaceae bacterium]|nr:TonB-dependent receptor [Marinilabiliaceae bacterium]